MAFPPNSHSSLRDGTILAELHSPKVFTMGESFDKNPDIVLKVLSIQKLLLAIEFQKTLRNTSLPTYWESMRPIGFLYLNPISARREDSSPTGAFSQVPNIS